MALPVEESDAAPVCVGIVVLNYHEAAASLRCIASLLGREPATTRIVWVENDAAATRDQLAAALAQAPFPWVRLDEGSPLPPAGTVGVLSNEENLGYAAGNNRGLRWLHRRGVEFAWVLNNDTELARGSSLDLVAASRGRPEVALWGTWVASRHGRYVGARIDGRRFKVAWVRAAGDLGRTALDYVSGSSAFFRLGDAAEVGFIPEAFFLYFEDPAFSQEFLRRGRSIAACDAVEVRHDEGLSIGVRSELAEYYSRRNRWIFIRRYFPDRLKSAVWRWPLTLQRYLVRGRWSRLRMEVAAFRDFSAGREGRTDRPLSRRPNS